jgi:glycosyltransferase involved in cell wall biosynthesis
MPDGREWPRATIVTPSFNHAPFLEATLRSVLLQGYPNLEYIVVDGGSHDGSVEILRRYEPWLESWVSELDRGQSDAINKGFRRAGGEILGWLNSDDLYEPNALGRVARFFAARPHCDLLYGRGSYIDEDERKTADVDWIRPFNRRLFLAANFILQPAAFWRRRLWEQVGELDPSCHWTMDWEWLIRASAISRPQYMRDELACWRFRPDIKTASGDVRRGAEIAAIRRRYGGFWQPAYLGYVIDLAARRRARRLASRGSSLLRRAVPPLRRGSRRRRDEEAPDELSV